MYFILFRISTSSVNYGVEEKSDYVNEVPVSGCAFKSDQMVF